MRILVACEESQVVTAAFRARGHEAYSCDLLPCSGGHPEWHRQQDVFLVLDEGGWDMLLAFPPCTHLAVSGARYFKEKQADERQQAAVEFFLRLTHAGIPKVAIENPIGIISRVWRKPDQIIQPWMFGEDASKATCLWLRGVTPLTATRFIVGRLVCCGIPLTDQVGKYGCANCGGEKKAKRLWANQTPSGQNRLGPSPGRARSRSRTYPGLAKAMAEQWG